MSNLFNLPAWELPFLANLIKSPLNFKPREVWLLPKAFRDILGKYKYSIINGGRASTKTQSVATFLIEESFFEKDCVFLCGREYLVSIKDSVYSVIAKLIKDPKHSNIKDFFEINNTEIVNKLTNVRFIFKGFNDFSSGSNKKSSNLAKIKSTFAIRYVWIDEAQTITKNTLETLVPTGRKFVVSYVNERDYDYQELNVNKDTKFLFTLNREKEVDDVIAFFEDIEVVGENYIFVTINLEDLEKKFRNPDMEALAFSMRNKANYDHIWRGAPSFNNEDTLFPFANFRNFDKIDNMEYVCIGVDPAVSTDKTSNLTGVVVCGYKNGSYYILEDLSGKYSPVEWREVVKNAYFRWNASCVVIENNQGGNLLKNNITEKYDITVKEVPSRSKKWVRAEPISVLYEKNKVFHSKGLNFLEKELNGFTRSGYKGPSDSPDRADALVHALIHVSEIFKEGIIDFDFV